MATDSQSSNTVIDEKTQMGKDDLLDLLSDETDDKKVEEKPEKKADKTDDDDDKKEKKSKPEDDLDELDDDDEDDDKDKDKDDDEDDDELDDDINSFVPVSKKAILKEFPTVFKKFPQLEAAYYKSAQYTEVFPTVEDAKEAAERSNSLADFEKDILDGNLEKLFSSVKANSPKTLDKIADNLLTTLSKVDEGTALHIVGNVFRQSLTRAANDGKRSKNEELVLAAKIINEYIFGEEEIKPPSKLERAVDTTESDKIKEERAQFEREKFQSVLDDLQTKADNRIKSTIDQMIDPKDEMSAYIKKNAVKDAFDSLNLALRQDAAFKRSLDNLWRSAQGEKYSSSSLDRIRTAYLSKAKTLIRDVVRNSRNEALKGSGQRRDPDKNRKGLVAQRGNSTSRNSSKAPEFKPGTSVKDFLMED